MLVRLENPKQFGCAPVSSSEPSSTVPENDNLKNTPPLFKCFYNIGQFKFKDSFNSFIL